METLVVVPQHRNRYENRNRVHGPARYGSLDSPPSRDFRGMNCRNFQSGAGLLPTPFKACSTPVTKQPFSFSSPKTPSPVGSHSDNMTPLKRIAKTSSISIPVNIGDDRRNGRCLNDEFCFSELWAGPAYSNSPPPSSLPIPKFSVRPKRTVSLDLPSSAPDIDFHPIAKSAPPSPTREYNHHAKNFFHSADSATMNLRRILNLDLTDE